MADDERVIPIEDPPAPDLDDLQQREIPHLGAVPVCVEGPVLVQVQPARRGTAEPTGLNQTPAHILGEDPRRSAATLLCDVAWNYFARKGGASVRWPADVPLVIQHCSEVWASVTTGTGNLSVISEYYAD